MQANKFNFSLSLKIWTNNHKQLMFHKAKPFKSYLCNNANWYLSSRRCSLSQSYTCMTVSFEDSTLRRRVQTFSHLQRWSAGAPLFPKDAPRLGCACVDLSEAPIWSFHAAQLSRCWKYGQTLTFLTLILTLSPPTVLSSSSASHTTLPPAGTNQPAVAPHFEVGACQLVQGIIKWK